MKRLVIFRSAPRVLMLEKQIVQEWGQSWNAGNDAIILTHRNDDVEAINQYARSLLKMQAVYKTSFL
ncbi:hypothetical protein [Brucella pseudogrignonensis]|uniref:hypothetical protein n=1 Tax=Brucella pseudogrignonensis TaxID=419475 RepID=UPI00148B4DF2|nr:hypothetical protein [Brucella pseudogrignonensis]